jgi:hypothetical protein
MRDLYEMLAHRSSIGAKKSGGKSSDLRRTLQKSVRTVPYQVQVPTTAVKNGDSATTSTATRER